MRRKELQTFFSKFVIFKLQYSCKNGMGSLMKEVALDKELEIYTIRTGEEI
jgi:hypothetical protein